MINNGISDLLQREIVKGSVAGLSWGQVQIILLFLSEEGVTRRNVGDTIIVIFLVTRSCLK